LSFLIEAIRVAYHRSRKVQIAGFREGGMLGRVVTPQSKRVTAWNRFLEAIEGRKTAKDKLFALFEVARHAPR
jgi:hypothetical protein